MDVKLSLRESKIISRRFFVYRKRFLWWSNFSWSGDMTDDSKFSFMDVKLSLRESKIIRRCFFVYKRFLWWSNFSWSGDMTNALQPFGSSRSSQSRKKVMEIDTEDYNCSWDWDWDWYWECEKKGLIDSCIGVKYNG